MILTTTKTVTVELTLQQIKNYMRAKNWSFESDTFRSPNGGEIGLPVIDGEQSLLIGIAFYERVTTHDLAMAILGCSEK